MTRKQPDKVHATLGWKPVQGAMKPVIEEAQQGSNAHEIILTGQSTGVNMERVVIWKESHPTNPPAESEFSFEKIAGYIPKKGPLIAYGKNCPTLWNYNNCGFHG